MRVHCMGNGRVCVYGSGADIFQAFGPEYSSPEAFRIKTDDAGANTEKLSRIAYRHKAAGYELLDYIPAGKDLFFRRISGRCALTVSFENGHVSPTPYENTVMTITKPGAPVYVFEYIDGKPGAYTSDKFRYAALRYSGDVKTERLSPYELRIDADGEALLTFAFSLTPQGLFAQLDGAADELTALYDEHDARLYPERDLGIGSDHPYYRQICDGYDVIVSQQSEKGSVLAGYNYHLSYVRDNYGVFRFFLAARAFSRARLMLDYYIGVFRDNGMIRNAQGMSEYAFHVHENDDTEITGYLVLMFTAYYAKTGDAGMLEKGMPLIEYCLRAQHGAMTSGMLTFNGDETYIAGGFLPRSAINDGSAEATALYDQAIAEILDAVSLPAELETALKLDREEIEKNYTKRFFGADGTFYCNCPGSGYEPAVRPGGPLLCGHGLGMGFRNKNGDYVCPDCLNKDLPPFFPGLYGKRFTVEAAVLCPAFVGASLIPRDTAYGIAKRVIEQLPARRRFVGYEYGMAMYSLGYDKTVADRILSLRDEFGAWSEYYEDGEQTGTLCRPWETGINLTALITTFEKEARN